MEIAGFHIEESDAWPPGICRRVASFLLRWGHFAEALPLIRRLAHEQPSGILYRSWLGECLLGLDRVEDAGAVLRALMAEHPKSPMAGSALVDLLLAQGRHAAAFDACQELFRPPAGERVAAWEKLAAYHLAAGEPAHARACCERCQALRAASAQERGEELVLPGPFLRLLARVHAACGDDAAAAATLRTAAHQEAEEAGILAALLGQAGCGPAPWHTTPSDVSAGSEDPFPTPGASPEAPTPAPSPLHPFTPSPTPPLSHSPIPPLPPGAEECLSSVFGHQAFLPGQAEVVGRVLAGEDVLAILPTGGGKSLCYQLPALHLPSAVVVISPLIALMRDQMENIPPALAPAATVINSSVESAAIEERLRGIAAGRFRLVYAAPERLRQWPFVHALRRAGVSLFVVDEAHCISLWGHDFRPDYFFIGPALEHLGRPPVLALTATATPQVQKEIGERLGRQFTRVSAGISRPNLRLEVFECPDEEAKLRLLLDFAGEEKGAAIIYARARDKCEELAKILRQNRVPAIHYHAGMDTAERDAAQAAFMGGQARVVCATVAFGMGIDKADVRLVLHFNLPKSVENYWQEAGRAGRDGRPARCVLLATRSDGGQLTRWMRQEALSLPLLGDLYHAARDLLGGVGPGRVILDDLARAVEKEEKEVRAALRLLERVGLLERLPDLPRTLSLRPLAGGDAAFLRFTAALHLRRFQSLPVDALLVAERSGIPAAELEGRLLEWRDAGWLEVRSSGRDALLALPRPPEGARATLETLLSTYQEQQKKRVSEMVAYACGSSCRHAFIARVFGEAPPRPCRSCDVCVPMAPGRPATRAARPARPAAASPELAALQVVAGLRYAVGRRGLVNILRASVAAPPSARDCPGFGALPGWTRGEVGRLIDRLVEGGALSKEIEDDLPLLRLTAAGRQALANGATPDAGRRPDRGAGTPPGPEGTPPDGTVPPTGGMRSVGSAPSAARLATFAPGSPGGGRPAVPDGVAPQSVTPGGEAGHTPPGTAGGRPAAPVRASAQTSTSRGQAGGRPAVPRGV